MRQKVFTTKGVRKPRILFWDLETAPLNLDTHSLYNERGIHTSAIKRHKYIISGSYKWAGEKRVDSVSVKPARPHDDRKAVRALHAVLSSADALVHHFGDAFDIRMFNMRAAALGLPPLPPIVQIDTWKIAKRVFKFESNRLDFLGEFLGLGRKISTNFKLWDACVEGDAAALREMVRYNKQDVLLLERVFFRLYPYTTTRLDIAALYDIPHAQRYKLCGHCGSTDMSYKGAALRRSRFHDMFQCNACDAWRVGPVVKPNKLATK